MGSGLESMRFGRMGHMTDEDRLARQESAEGRTLLDENIPSILQEYEKRIPLPERSSRKPWILAVVGLVGSGKTTVVKFIADQMNMPRISTDMLRHVLAENGFNMVRTVDLAKVLAQKYLEAGYSISLDGDAITPEHRELFAQAAKHFGIPLVLIHVNTPDETVLEQLRGNNEQQHSGLARDVEGSIEAHARRKPLHEKYLQEITFDAVFDISQPDFHQRLETFVATMHDRGF